MEENYIRQIRVDDVDTSQYPFTIPAVQQIEDILFTTPVTFFVGENGTGKSTIIEALAVSAGFSAEGGTKNYHYDSINSTSSLCDHITLIRNYKRERYGYFLRAESFYTTANYADAGTFDKEGNPIPIFFDGKRIHEQSHGEAFLAIAKEFRPGLFIFDEPESALSPKRLLVLMSVVHKLAEMGSQFIIATHSPILLAFPGSKIYQLSKSGIEETDYDNIEHVKVTREFLSDPSLYLESLEDF